jgi:UDP-glucose 4-epimerase
MRIVMTGASGFLGTSLRRAFGGNEVFALGRARGSPAPGLRHVIADLSVPLSLRGLPDRCDAVLHLAQPRRDEPHAERDTFAVNVGATEDLIGYARSSGARVFVFASTGNVYAPGTAPHDEHDPLDASTRDPYVRSKIEGERVVARHSDEVRCLVFRPFTPYGPRQRRRMIPDLIERIRAGRPVVLTNGGRPSVNPVYVADLVAWIVAALSRDEVAGAFNLAGDEVVDVKDLALMIGRLAGRQVRVEDATAPMSIDLVGSNDRIATATGLRPGHRLEAGLRELIEEIVPTRAS